MTDRSLSHLDPFGGTRMVDVSPKEATHRRALARCKVAMKPETTAKVANNASTNGFAADGGTRSATRGADGNRAAWFASTWALHGGTS